MASTKKFIIFAILHETTVQKFWRLIMKIQYNSLFSRSSGFYSEVCSILIKLFLKYFPIWKNTISEFCGPMICRSKETISFYDQTIQNEKKFKNYKFKLHETLKFNLGNLMFINLTQDPGSTLGSLKNY